LRHVEDGVIGRFVVRAEQGASRGCGAVPYVRLGSCLLCALVGGLEVCDRVGFGSRRVRGLFGFEGPEMEDQARPQATERMSEISRDHIFVRTLTQHVPSSAYPKLPRRRWRQ
jgi:hypothetical protein